MLARITEAANSFDWKDAPLNDVTAPIVAGVCYLFVVFCIKKFRPDTPSPTVKAILQSIQVNHNLILCAWSYIMFVGCAYEVYQRYRSEGVKWLYCEDPSREATGGLYFWSYIYYFSKYYELLDTIIVLVKGSTPPHFFLHVYHHSVVVFMAWSWLHTKQSLQFGGLLFNTAVHVVMYYYYHLQAKGIRPKWKHWITTFQILQFVSSLVMAIPTLAAVGQKGWDHCAGMNGFMFNMVFNVTLLFQFVQVLSPRGPKPNAEKITPSTSNTKKDR